MFDKIDTIKTHLLRWSGVVVFLLLWEAAPRLGWLDAQFAPPFSTVLGAIHELAADGSLAKHLVISIWRGVTGLLVATLVAIPAGFLLGLRLPVWAAVLDPFLRVLSQVNPFSLMPVFILFFGIGETAKIVVIAWVSLWPILFYTITAVRNVDPLLLKTARSLGITTGELYLKVILPASLPVIFVGLRIGAGLVFFMIVAAEMLGANAGLGWLVHNSAMNYQTPRIYAGATFIVILGYLLNRFLLALERAFFSGEQEQVDLVPARRSSAPSWRPGWRSAAAAASVIFVFLLAGGREVYLSNLANASLGGHLGHQEEAGEANVEYTCPMHPFIVREKPDVCPLCGMRLVRKSDAAHGAGH
ncbi:MAG: ABC transporter permease [Geobacter sp.]|nr:ABC transporter permease [Geobacter sp.]